MSNDKNFNDRLKIAIGSKSVRAFAKECAVSEVTLRHYLSGKTDPTRLKLIQIAEAAGVSVEWLVTGRGRQEAGLSGSTGYRGPVEEWLAEVRKKKGNTEEELLEIYSRIDKFKEWYDKKRGDNSVQETPIQKKQVA